MDTFIRICEDIQREHYITHTDDTCVYYGHVIPGHENKQPTAVMTKQYYNKLLSDGLIIGHPG